MLGLGLPRLARRLLSAEAAPARVARLLLPALQNGRGQQHLLQAAKRRGVSGWIERTPKEFGFTVKASRYMTHVKRLKEPESTSSDS